VSIHEGPESDPFVCYLERPAATMFLTAFYGVWRSPVARLLWEQEVPGSNPGAPIT